MQSTLAFLSADFGASVAAIVLSSLADTDRALVHRVRATDEIPYALLVRLWERIDATLRTADRSADAAHAAATWAERAGEAAINSYGVQLYGGILRKPSPLEFLTQSISLFRLYYQPGDMDVVESDSGHAVLRLVGFDPVTPIFCRRQTGGLRQALTLAGGGESRARHVRCVLEGDAFCEWALSWHTEVPAPEASSPAAPTPGTASPGKGGDTRTAGAPRAT